MTGKKSFLFYVNWESTFDTLSDEEAGRLIKHILHYVNDRNPEAPDRITELVFQPIKAVLKEDLKKWELFVEKQRENGKKGGRPNNPILPEETQPFLEKPKKAVNVNVKDNDLKTPFIPPSGGESVSTDLKSWKTDYQVYLIGLRNEFRAVKKDADWIAKQEKFNPGVDVILSIEKACTNYWATEGGWKKKKRAKIVDIDWRSTFANAITMNRVYKPKATDNDSKENH